MEVRIRLFDPISLRIETDDSEYLSMIKDEFTKFAPNYRFTPLYRSGHWDGRICMIDKMRSTFPYGILMDYVRIHKRMFPRNRLVIEPEVKALFKGPEITPVYDLKLEPRPYQRDCIESSIRHTKGIIRSATASGKSLVIAYIIRNLMRVGEIQNAIIIVPTTALITQFYQDLVDYGFSPDDIGAVFSERKQWDRKIVISTWQSLAKVPDNVNNYGCIFCDECLSGETKVKTSEGEKVISDIKKGDKVISYNQKNRLFEEDIVCKTFENLIISDSEEMYEIEFENGGVLRATGNHKILTTLGYKTIKSIVNDIDNINRYEVIEHRANEMNNRSIKLISKLNSILEEYHQNLRILFYKNYYMYLSNGMEILGKNECQRTWRRIQGKNSYTINFDLLYDRNKTLSEQKEKDLVFINSSNGGIAAQKIYGDKIRKNLNTGIPWNKGKSLHYNVWHKGKNKNNDSRLMDLSIKRTGPGNPMFGHEWSDEYKLKKSYEMKEKILKGEFTPNIHNSNTHFQYIIEGKKFRSSWESIYFLLNKDDSIKYEYLRIPYIKKDGKKSVYITDFINYNNKELIEIKPSCHNDLAKFALKKDAAIEWCKKNGFNFIMVNEDYFVDKENDIRQIEGYDNIKTKVLDMVKRENKKYKKNR